MDYKKYIGGYVDPEISFDHSSIDNDEIDKRASDMLDYLDESYIEESVKIRDQIGKSEIEDIKTVISSLNDGSFKDFKFIDMVYCDIRYRSRKPIAFITIRAKLINNSTVGYVSLAVNPKYQNQGIGKSLTEKAVSWFKTERGIHFLEWHCLPDNEASRKLANSAGFREYIAKEHEDYAHYAMESSYIEESNIINQKDIYYNKDKFDSGEINLCFITGHSGSGKSTMARSMQNTKVEHYELDDLNQNYKFTDDNLKEYGDLIYSFFKGPGKKYRYYSYDDMQNCTNPLDDSGDEFDKCVNRDFVKYAMKYANSHKNTKFVIEGIWLYFFFKPEELKDYAVYIKGTSRVLSAFRAAKRDSKDADSKAKRFLFSIKGTISTINNKYSREGEKLINKYRDYYGRLKKQTNESYIEEFDLPKRPYEQKVSEEILDTIKSIILTSQNKSKASKLGLDLKCEITEVDSGMVFILILDGPQDKRDTEEARSLLKDLASKCKSKLSDIVSKVDIGDGDEGCLFFTMDKGKIRRKRKDLLESYVEEKFHIMSNPYRKKVIKSLNQYDYIFSKYGSNYKDQRDKEVGNVSGSLSIDNVGNFFVNHFDNDKKGISTGISYWCYRSITSGNLDKLKSDIRSLNREVKSKGIKFDLYGINPNEKVHKYVWVFLYFLDDRRKSLDESSIEEDVETEASPKSFVKRSSLPTKNQKSHAQYLRKKAHSNKTNNATVQSELPKFNQIGELSFEEVAKGVKVKPIFIITSYTNTSFGKVIKTFTHAKYTHAAIAFDTSLEQLYSFNADPKVTTNGNKGGISRESLSEYINTYDKAIIQVNCILCKESDFDIVKNTLDDIFRKESDTRYGYMNILNILIGRVKDTGMSMVCSQFVSYILHKADIKLVDKPDNLVEPKDLSTIVNPRVYKLYEGAAKDYDKKKIDRIFRKLKTKALLIKESLLEYCV